MLRVADKTLNLVRDGGTAMRHAAAAASVAPAILNQSQETRYGGDTANIHAALFAKANGAVI
jgi:hypothetical protein